MSSFYILVLALSASPVGEHLEFSLLAELVCVCGYRSSREELYRDITVDCMHDASTVNRSSNRSLVDLLDKYFQSEKCDVKCERCGRPDMLMSRKLNKLPTYFIAHLNRFHVDMAANEVIKITEEIDIPESLDMIKWCTVVEPEVTLPLECPYNNSPVVHESRDEMTGLPSPEELFLESTVKEFNVESKQNAITAVGTENCVYKLKAIVRHVGVGTVSGHYIIDIHTGNENESRWTRYNDLIVFNISEVNLIHFNIYISM